MEFMNFAINKKFIMLEPEFELGYDSHFWLVDIISDQEGLITIFSQPLYCNLLSHWRYQSLRH
jgi:hypothetical protein